MDYSKDFVDFDDEFNECCQDDEFDEYHQDDEFDECCQNNVDKYGKYDEFGVEYNDDFCGANQVNKSDDDWDGLDKFLGENVLSSAREYIADSANNLALRLIERVAEFVKSLASSMIKLLKKLYISFTHESQNYTEYNSESDDKNVEYDGENNTKNSGESTAKKVEKVIKNSGESITEKAEKNIKNNGESITKKVENINSKLNSKNNSSIAKSEKTVKHGAKKSSFWAGEVADE